MFDLVVKRRESLSFLLAMFFIFICSRSTLGRVGDSTKVKTVSEVLADRDTDGKPDLLGQQVTLSGRATVGSSVLSKNYFMVFMQDSSQGIMLFSEDFDKQVNEGDSLVVKGKLQMYYGKPQIVVEEYIIVETKAKMVAPVTTKEIYSNPENYLGQFVKAKALVTGKEIDEEYISLTISPGDTSSSFLRIFLSTSHNLFKEFDLKEFNLGDKIIVKGILDKYRFQDSEDVIYEIIPRTPDDIAFAEIPRTYIENLLWGSIALILLIVGWIISLKKKVRTKTKDLSKALQQKEHLMQEIHHRVKNNLAMISGLLDLQIDTSVNPQVQQSLEDSKSRIQSMAVIHSKLYQTKSYDVVRLDVYLEELVDAIQGTFIEKHDSVDCQFSLEVLEISADQAITCGLLVNELVINAFKYAFDRSDHGVLEVKLQRENGIATLTVADNGPGLPEDMKMGSQDSLGFVLINTFTEQLEGEMEVQNGNSGAAFSFRFPIISN